MKLTIFSMTLLLTSSSVVAAAPRDAAFGSPAERTARFSDLTDIREFDQMVAELGTTQISEVVVQLSEGQASWELLDPEGNVKLSGEGQSGRTKTMTTMAAAGTWRLRLTLTHATGDYQVRWTDGRDSGSMPLIRFGLTRRRLRCTT